MVSGSVSVAPFGGASGLGGGGSGLLKKTENVTTFDGALRTRFALTAMTRVK